MHRIIICEKDRAQETASLLLACGAIKINTQNPYRLTSGNLSPVYADCRRLISYPVARARIIELMFLTIDELNLGIDVVAGGETAGIAFAAFLAARMDLPMIYIRKTAKGFGTKKQIEGKALDKGKSILLVEDLISQGSSKKIFVEALRNASLRVEHCAVIFSYKDDFLSCDDILSALGIKVYALTDWDMVLSVASKDYGLSAKDDKIIRDFLLHPNDWHIRL